MLLWISSGRKLRGSIQVPASMPATLRPARASGSTATPPAAPRPTTATSTGFRLVAMAASVCGCAHGLDRHDNLLLLGGDREPRARIADQIPAGEIPVPAVEGISEHTFERQLANAQEKRARIGSES